LLSVLQFTDLDLIRIKTFYRHVFFVETGNRWKLRVLFKRGCISPWKDKARHVAGHHKSIFIFVLLKVIFEKLIFKFSCVCLSLEKLVNGKYFPVKEKFGLVSRKLFFFLAVFVFRKVVSGKSLSKLSCVCLSLEKLVNEKHFPDKGKFGLVFRKVFSWKIWTKNTFRKLWKI